MMFALMQIPSHATIAIKPTSASDIKYAVMLRLRASRETNMRHDRLRDHFRREPYPSKCDPLVAGSSRWGRVRTWTSHGPRADTFARAGQSDAKSPQPISLAAGFLISAMM